MSVLESKDIVKYYGPNIKALDKVSISVEKGTVLGLLGPNGAGKTTFVRIVATQLLPSGGTVSFLGHDIVKDPSFARRNIAVVPQEGRPLSLQTPYEHIVTYLVTRGCSFSEARKRANETIIALKLESYKDRICSNLSGGLRQKVLIAMAMSTDAELLILDEPTIGLDPVARVDVWLLIRSYVSRGKTIILTTHYMEEAEELADRLAIVNQGKVVAVGTPAELKAKLGSTHAVVIRASSGTEKLEVQSFGGRLLDTGTSLRILFPSQEKAGAFAAYCLQRGLDVSVRHTNLEDFFISEVGGALDSS